VREPARRRGGARVRVRGPRAGRTRARARVDGARRAPKLACVPDAAPSALDTRLTVRAASVQDALLLAMTRLADACERVPPGVADGVTKLQESAGRHIQRVRTRPSSPRPGPH
jgi:hypothetical protein